MAESPQQETPSQRLFYLVFVAGGVVTNLVVGVVVLSGLATDGHLQWLKLGTGAFCCVVGGWLASAGWSKFYWNRSMARQVALWRQIADAFFTWLEEAPLPPESLRNLKSSLDRVVPTVK